MERMVIALGGNALQQKGDPATFDSQLSRAKTAFVVLSRIIPDHEVLITHGNGPQVGNILIQNETSKDVVPPMPLDACGSMSQGLIGQLLVTAYEEIRNRYGISKEPVTVFTRTLVDPGDPAFHTPTKPIGPFYTQEEAAALMAKNHWQMKNDAGRGWRRLVASPYPKEILERRIILGLLRQNFLPISTGGGGIPVVKTNGFYQGVEAVIDKDLASSVLAASIGCSRLMILTDVPNAFIDYGKPDQKAIGTVTLNEAVELYDQMHFGSGSMAPKVLAAINFIKNGGKISHITSLDNSYKALYEGSGTTIVKN